MRSFFALLILATSLGVLAAPVSDGSTPVSSVSLHRRLAVYDFLQDADVDLFNNVPRWGRKRSDEATEDVDFLDSPHIWARSKFEDTAEDVDLINAPRMWDREI